MKESYRGKKIEGITFYTVWQISMLLRTWPDELDVYIKNGDLKSQEIEKSTMISEANLERFLETHPFPARRIGGDI